MLKYLLPAVAWACLCFPVPAHAIVSIGQAIIGPVKDGLHTNVELASNGVSGTTSSNNTLGGLFSEWKHGKYTDFLLLQYAYGQSNGQINNNRAFAHLRHRMQLSDRWGIEGFAQVMRDPVTRMVARNLLGGGVRYTLLERTDKAAAYLGLGAFYEHDRLSAKTGTTDALDTRLWRNNTYLMLKRQLNAHLSVYSVTYYQPALNDMGNYRVLEQAAGSVKLYKNLNLKLSTSVYYDSRPPQGVKRTYVLYSTGITADF
jgi:putative salt-induced outer membrane protein YdiY